jgi:histidinol-phosphate aminotransferase
VEFRKVLLTLSFELDAESLLSATDARTKIIFLCSPNNPTSNRFSRESIMKVLHKFEGIVVLDEAYIDFSPDKGFLPFLASYPNLVILQTLSKAWGMAGIRLGMAFADPNIIRVLTKIKYPYNINVLTLETALRSLKNSTGPQKWIEAILQQRSLLEKELSSFSFVRQVFPSDANFLLVKVDDPRDLHRALEGQKIIVRDRSGMSLCEGCLRITVGTAEENAQLLKALNAYQQSGT